MAIMNTIHPRVAALRLILVSVENAWVCRWYNGQICVILGEDADRSQVLRLLTRAGYESVADNDDRIDIISGGHSSVQAVEQQARA